MPSSIVNGAGAVLDVYLAFLRWLPADKKVFVVCDPSRIEEIASHLSEAGVACECQFVPSTLR